MRQKIILLIFLGIFVSSCNDVSPQSQKGWRLEEINSRLHQPIYIVNVPDNWKRLDPSTTSLGDTRVPLVTYIFSENKETFTITIHNFPLQDIQDQVPAYAQVERWKRQFDSLDQGETELVKISYAGYTGLFFKGIGIYKGNQEMMLAWSLLISPENFRALIHPDSPAFKTIYDQMRSDITIKVLGPVDIVSKHRDEIEKFASSFHMIQEIPQE